MLGGWHGLNHWRGAQGPLPDKAGGQGNAAPLGVLRGPCPAKTGKPWCAVCPPWSLSRISGVWTEVRRSRGTLRFMVCNRQGSQGSRGDSSPCHPKCPQERSDLLKRRTLLPGEQTRFQEEVRLLGPWPREGSSEQGRKPCEVAHAGCDITKRWMFSA
jgi:hypothetical protein